MENNATKGTVLTVALVVFILLSGLLFISRSTNLKKLNAELIRSETLASEKSAVEESLGKLRTELSAANVLLGETITEKDNRIGELDGEINRLRSQAISASNLKKQIADLEAGNNALAQEIESLKKAVADLGARNQVLDDRATALEKENGQLKGQVEILNALIADNLRINAYRGKKDKLTLKASRTEKLVASFEIPADMASGLSFTIETPDGNVISSDNEPAATINITNSVETGLQKLSSFSQGFKTVEITYAPVMKLSKGNYKVSLQHQKQHISGVILQLK